MLKGEVVGVVVAASQHSVVQYNGGGSVGLVRSIERRRCMIDMRRCRAGDAMMVALQMMVLGFGFGAGIILFVYLGCGLWVLRGLGWFVVAIVLCLCV